MKQGREIAAFANDPLLFEPDSEYRYSTYGRVLVSAAVEADLLRSEQLQQRDRQHC